MKKSILIKNRRRVIVPIAVLLFWCFGTSSSYAAVSFETPVLYDLLGETPLGMVNADFDGDGDIDLATTLHAPAEETPEEQGVFIHLNNGKGSFTLGNHVHFTEEPTILISSDFDNDNDIDLVALNTQSDDLVILLNDNAGNFTIDSRIQIGYTYFQGMTPTDIDNDGDIDITILFADGGNAQVLIYENGGVADFEQSTILNTNVSASGTGLSTNGVGPIFAQDFNGDSFVDISVIAGDLHIFYNNSDGTFTHLQNELPTYNGYTTSAVTPIDTDGDGDLDLIAYQGAVFSTMVNIRGEIFYPDSNPIFIPGTILNIPPTPGAYTITDLDNDGDYDVTTTNDEGELNVYLQNSTDDFILLETINIPYLTGSDPIISTDLNNDGKSDLKVLIRESETGNTYYIFLQVSGLTPIEQVDELKNILLNFNLPRNITNSYSANLNNATQFIQNGQIQPAINQLNAFIHKVNQSYNQNKITLVQRDIMITAAETIISALTSN